MDNKLDKTDPNWLLQTMDAQEWAKEFIRIAPDATDEGSMIGWFANAIMTGYDAGARKEREAASAPAPQAAQPVIGPTYYVRHPDDTYSVADPQPATSPAPAVVQMTDEQIMDIWTNERRSALHAGGLIADPVKFARAILSASGVQHG